MPLDTAVWGVSEVQTQDISKNLKMIVDETISKVKGSSKADFAHLLDQNQIYDFLVDSANYPMEGKMVNSGGTKLSGDEAVKVLVQTYIGFILNPYPYGCKTNHYHTNEDLEQAVLEGMKANNLCNSNILDHMVIFMQKTASQYLS
jgi:hypothetical protein